MLQVSDNHINRQLQLDDGDEKDSASQVDSIDFKQRYPDHCIVNNWYYPLYNREKAEEALYRKKDGTFLIRDRTEAKIPYSCSLVAHGTVHHCRIERTVHGYGFEPYKIYPTVKDLVLHYAHNSLVDLNDTLDTTLRMPFACSHVDAIELKQRYPDHCIVTNWYYSMYSRVKAEEALYEKEDGTFLIRDRANEETPHACSLVAHGTVHHCLIERTVNGYRFAEFCNLHPTLKDLVLYYARNSLISHNDMLDTTLRIPLACSRR